MESESVDIPEIDLAAWTSPSSSPAIRSSLAKTWHTAFSTHGLVWLSGHGLSSQLSSTCQEWLQFCSLPARDKARHAAATYGQSGYNGPGSEAVGRSEGGQAAADPVESLESGYSEQFLGPFPRAETGYRGGDGLRDSCQRLYRALDCEVLGPCLALASLALGMEEGELARRWTEQGQTAAQLRLARYQPSPAPGPQLLYGEHTDYDGFTFLWRSRTNGLEALLEGSWRQVPLLQHSPDSILVNLGDLMEAWTGGVWRSPRHRVLRPASQGAGREDLVSIVWFAGPHPSTRLVALPSPLLPPQQEDTVLTAGQHVRDKIDRTAQNS